MSPMHSNVYTTNTIILLIYYIVLPAIHIFTIVVSVTDYISAVDVHVCSNHLSVSMTAL